MINTKDIYSAVVFDLDGVLIDSELIHLKSAEIVLARRGIHLTPEQAAQQTGITIHKFLEKVVNEWGFPGPKEGENWVAEKRAVFRELAETELQPVAGVDDFLRALRSSQSAGALGASCCGPTKIKIGLASSSPRPYIDWMVKKFRWEGLFDAICTIEDVRHPKPDPQMYRLTVERLGVESRGVLAFEDSPAGIQAAVVAGVDCVGVGTSFSSEKLLAAGAKWFIRDFTDRETLKALVGAVVAWASGP